MEAVNGGYAQPHAILRGLPLFKIYEIVRRDVWLYCSVSDQDTFEQIWGNTGMRIDFAEQIVAIYDEPPSSPEAAAGHPIEDVNWDGWVARVAVVNRRQYMGVEAQLERRAAVARCRGALLVAASACPASSGHPSASSSSSPWAGPGAGATQFESGLGQDGPGPVINLTSPEGPDSNRSGSSNRSSFGPDSDTIEEMETDHVLERSK
eukprot:951142-Pyramimonas_sp.AAC.3